jgi:hypothetical protein
MIIYLAGTNKKQLARMTQSGFILESFAYIQKHLNELPLLLKNKVMMDSGAFTFIGRGKKKQQKINWEAYIEQYAKFVRENNIADYIELDIYSVVGKKRTEVLREYLEKLVGWKSIPVWHRYLGLEYWYELLKEYKYVAIGASGRYDSAWCRSHPEILKSLVLNALKHGARVHGLGYTELAQLDEIKFASVDSTTWVNGQRFGEMHRFNGSRIVKIRSAHSEIKTIKGTEDDLKTYNFTEWVKYQQWAVKNL